MGNKHTLALHIAGWKIVANDDDPDASTPKWPFDSKAFDCDCPEWCDDISARRETPLRLQFWNFRTGLNN